MKIRQKRDADTAQVPSGPVVVTIHAVHADAKNLGVRFTEILEPRLQRGNFLASSRGPVQGVEDQHHMAFPHKLREAEGYTKMAVECEIRGLGSDFDHVCLLLLSWIEYECRFGLRRVSDL